MSRVVRENRNKSAVSVGLLGRIIATRRAFGMAVIAVVLTANAGCNELIDSLGSETTKATGVPTSRVVREKSTPVQEEDKPVHLVSLDWNIGNGHFYTQTNGKEVGTSATGFGVTNWEGVLFWDKFNELGGESALGYPLSQRFEWRGMPTQVFQRGVLQWDPVSRQVMPLNTLDELSKAGKDEWLHLKHATPGPLPSSFDAGKPWDRIVRDRLVLLRSNPAIDRYYAQARDPLGLYGLPISQPTAIGNHVTVRFQRAVIREWKIASAGYKAGELVVENVGQWAVEAGLFPRDPFVPEPAPPWEIVESAGQRSALQTGGPTPQATTPQRNDAAAQNIMRVGNTGGIGVFVRRTPHMADKIVAWPDNTIMQTTGQTTSGEGHSWVQVKDPAGNVGWIPQQYLVRN